MTMFRYYLLSIISVLIFFYGFFPVPKYEKGKRESLPLQIQEVDLNSHEIYKTEFTKTVLVVIDALRLDFVNSQYMPKLWENILHQGCISQVTVQSPTVTLPRIKALTSGSVPQFIDVVLNLATTDVLPDSIIHSAHDNHKRIVFYGDNTWLKVFPKHFQRHEGTSSFFVKDFKEVDDNVTKNALIELDRTDWDIMVLHYLGLDHIGHVLGPWSPLVKDKLIEMEDIIMKIYSKLSLRKENVLMIITSDHGMRSSGGHGGSSFFETNVPFVLLGLNCRDDKIAQTDISVNLAVLLGLEIPSTSIGKLSSNLLVDLFRDKYLLSLMYNTKSLLKKKPECLDVFDEAQKHHKNFLQSHVMTEASKAAELYENCSKSISESLIHASIEQNLALLVLAIILMIFALTVFIKNTAFNVQTSSIKLDSIPLILLYVFHPLTFFSSSYVEEEQQYWYFCFQFITIIFISKYGNMRKISGNMAGYILFYGACFRFLITINQSGDKWANLNDFSDWLQKIENVYYLQIFFICGLLSVAYYIHIHSKRFFTSLIAFLTLFLIFILKNDERNNVTLGQLIWVLIIIILYFDDLIVGWLLICSLLLKPYNIVLIPYCVAVCTFFNKTIKNMYVSYLSFISLGNALYFAQGHSNSLASVDVSVGYIGLSDYSPFFVILQVLFHTYALPVLCHIFFLKTHKELAPIFWSILIINRLYINIIVSVVTLIFKDHLFIWSVFAPKLFIETISTSFVFLEICFYTIYVIIQNVYSKYELLNVKIA